MSDKEPKRLRTTSLNQNVFEQKTKQKAAKTRLQNGVFDMTFDTELKTTTSTNEMRVHRFLF